MADREPLSGSEVLMWRMDRDPVLRSSFANISILRGGMDAARLRARVAATVAALPRLHQRVDDGHWPLGAPEWVDDPAFDLDHHLRHIALPAPRTLAHLTELASQWLEDAFDSARPLWQMTVVDGLSGGRSALVTKLHHAVTDGTGGMRLSAHLVDFDAAGTSQAVGRDPGADRGPPADGSSSSSSAKRGPDEPSRRPAARAVGALADLAGTAAGAVTDPWALGRGALHAASLARSIARQTVVTGGARSPLWAHHHSSRRHLEVLSVDLERVRRAARALGGTVNDLYVSAVAGGAAAYHRALGAEVDELRVSVPVSIRSGRGGGGNQFAPARVLLPAGMEDPRARFAAVHERLAEVKSERALGLADAVAGAVSGLPDPVLSRLVRQQVGTVDFAASNVRGSPVELFIAGARLLANHPMGPTVGTAFNATVLSYRSRLDLGINVDAAAVVDPVLLRDCIEASLAELTAGRPGARRATT